MQRVSLLISLLLVLLVSSHVAMGESYPLTRACSKYYLGASGKKEYVLLYCLGFDLSGELPRLRQESLRLGVIRDGELKVIGDEEEPSLVKDMPSVLREKLSALRGPSGRDTMYSLKLRALMSLLDGYTVYLLEPDGTTTVVPLALPTGTVIEHGGTFILPERLVSLSKGLYSFQTRVEVKKASANHHLSGCVSEGAFKLCYREGVSDMAMGKVMREDELFVVFPEETIKVALFSALAKVNSDEEIADPQELRALAIKLIEKIALSLTLTRI